LVARLLLLGLLRWQLEVVVVRLLLLVVAGQLGR